MPEGKGKALPSMSDRIVCYCINVPESRIVAAVRAGAHSLQEVKEQTGACTGGRCAEMNPTGQCCSADILEIIEREAGVSPSASSCCTSK